MSTWDHVVVGAGSAGAVVAARLAQDQTSTVLVLEAGPDHTSAAAPAAIGGRNFYAALAEPARIWPDLVARRTSAGEPVPYVRGRGVGGSSSVNAMLALEGEPGEGLRLADGSEVTAGHVWICSGAIHSPAILLRSGLTRAGIGRNLKDHASTQVTLMLNDRGRLPDVDCLPFTVVHRFSSGAISHDLQMLPMGHLGVTERGMLMLGLMQVNSAGTVTIVSDVPDADPAVDFAMFSSPGDLERLAEGVHELVREVRHPAFAAICDEVVIDDARPPPEAIDDER